MKDFHYNIVILILCALIGWLYLGFVPAGVLPGNDGRTALGLTGDGMVLSPKYPVWRAVSSLPVNSTQISPAVVSGYLNTCFAVISLGLFAFLVKFFLYEFHTARPERARRFNRVGAQMGGVCALLWLGGSSPFMVSATRSGPMAFHLLLLLTAFFLLFFYFKYTKRWLPPFIAFFLGIAAAEYPTLYFLGPVYLVLLLWEMYNNSHFSFGLLAGCCCAGVAGMALVYAGGVFWFMQPPGHVLRNYGQFHQTLWQLLLEQYRLSVRSLPQVGWLLTIILTVLPLAACLVMISSLKRQAVRMEHYVVRMEHYVLYLILLAVTSAVLFNIPGTPWMLLGASRLLLLPYVMSALAFACIFFFWFNVTLEKLMKTKDTRLFRIYRIAPAIVSLIFAFIVISGVVFNRAAADPLPANLLRRFAEDVVDSLDGRGWLVTDGVADENIEIVARERGIDVTLINLRQGRSPVYLQYLQGLFDDPTLKNLAGIGVMPLLQVWIQSDADIDDKLALLVMPELWISSGFVPVPNRTVYFGARRIGEVDVEGLAMAQRSFWDAALLRYSDEQEAQSAAGVLDYIRNHLSVVANNFGVLMEDAGLPEEAWRSYSASRRFLQDNFSAVLNMRAMIERGLKPELREEFDVQIAEWSEHGRFPRDVWQLSRSYGLVRSPEIFVRMGMDWARTGQPGAAVAGLQRALDMLPDQSHAGLKNTLAGMLFADMQPEKSAQIYRELLSENSDNIDAMLGMARIEALRGNDAVAQALLADVAAIAGEDADIPLKVEKAAVMLLMEQPAEARLILSEVLDEQPQNLRAWNILFVAILMQQDTEGMTAFRNGFSSAGFREHPMYGLAQAYEYLLSDRLNEAAAAFARLAENMPGSLLVIDPLIRISLTLSDFSSALKYARMALQIDSRHTLGNYVQGSYQLSQGSITLAEDSLRRSLASGKTFMAMNDLAWLLAERGDYNEAEMLAREAAEMRPGRYEPLDTLGLVLTKTGKFNEARKVFEQALSFAPESADVYLHYGQLLLALGDKSEARKKLDGAERLKGQLSAVQQNHLTELLLKLGDKL